MARRNRSVERTVLAFYTAMPKYFRQFALDIREIIRAVKNYTLLSYQEAVAQYGVSMEDVMARCESEVGCVFKTGDTYVIMYNDADDIPEGKKRFTLAHELAHIVLRHFEIVEADKIAENIHFDTMLERESDNFAACLLCPCQC